MKFNNNNKKSKNMASTKVVTGKVRFSYLKVFKPESITPSQEPKYSVSVLIPKSDKKTIKKINDAINAAKELGKSSKFNGSIPKNLRSPLRDGDIDRPEDEAYADHFFVNASNTRKPEVVNADLEPIISQDEINSGDYGRVSINFFPYNFENTSKGIGASLNNIQKLEDGEILGATIESAASEFGDDDDDDLM